jgi:hypothetical protein
LDDGAVADPALGRNANADEPEIIAERFHRFQGWTDLAGILGRRSGCREHTRSQKHADAGYPGSRRHGR